ncbi:RNA polymerase sigma factor SigJ [Virgibacillus sp. NKC19-3]|uniref:RNA polymerase sigma factor SigJ n=1 Tax=Virgibacillus saliphilus TaxID=2831674 RepID=UPI001C9BBB81|nr:RNA polymerase sigma factor SigJ [Virgibacillus sp. NKC19-3]MBY7141723.1 RNA polymerase sigma factor SigJ [Virgibacillus sp. NKC19-3]
MHELYRQYKGLLFTLAYQLTGSTADAEDVVQDVFLKLHDIKQERLVEPKAYLCKMVTNRCLDLLKSARKKREHYFGQWLPEPIPTSIDEAFESVAQDELLSYAIIVLLERLSPIERTVFVLREALSLEYAVISELIDKSEENCRKIISRSRGKLGIDIKEPINAQNDNEEWVRQFLVALEQGHIDNVVSMLSEDVTLVSDGGGKAPAALYPIESSHQVARLLLGLIRKAPNYAGGVNIELSNINGQIGLVMRSKKGIIGVMLMYIKSNVAHNLYFVWNPDKLRLLSK